MICDCPKNEALTTDNQKIKHLRNKPFVLSIFNVNLWPSKNVINNNL